MTLQELLQGVEILSIDPPEANPIIDSISSDSREQMTKGIFVALKGFVNNANHFITQAINQGACVIVKEDNTRLLSDGQMIPAHIVVISVKETKLFLRTITLRLYDHPSQSVRCIGVTGTNGKTTFTYFLEAILKAAGVKCGIVGTINYRIAGELFPSKNTTPSFSENQNLLVKLRSHQIPYCVMEASSHALDQGRLDGIDFVSGVFTNLTQDHLDYHGTMENYFTAKAKLFKSLKPSACAILNTDDPYGQQLIQMTQARIISYGIDQPAMIKAENIHYELSGTTFDLLCCTERISIITRFIGKHNVYNILSAAAFAYGEKLSIEIIKQGITSLTHVPGRLEPVDLGQNFFIFIDYAHTEDGLMNMMKSLRTTSKQKMIVVFGCGGDRDASKRAKMGRVVSELADYAIVTSDNPRSEDPHSIINAITCGFIRDNYEICLDRKEAIGKALSMAKADNIVVLAGKGHEDYQILNTGKIAFNERGIVKEFLLKCLPLKK